MSKKKKKKKDDSRGTKFRSRDLQVMSLPRFRCAMPRFQAFDFLSQLLVFVFLLTNRIFAYLTRSNFSEFCAAFAANGGRHLAPRDTLEINVRFEHKNVNFGFRRGSRGHARNRPNPTPLSIHIHFHFHSLSLFLFYIPYPYSFPFKRCAPKRRQKKKKHRKSEFFLAPNPLSNSDQHICAVSVAVSTAPTPEIPTASAPPQQQPRTNNHNHTNHNNKAKSIPSLHALPPRNSFDFFFPQNSQKRKTLP
jgi:hypothetical protein